MLECSTAPPTRRRLCACSGESANPPVPLLPFALYANQNYCHATVFCYAPSMASTVLDEDIASGQFLLSAIIKFENNLS